MTFRFRPHLDQFEAREVPAIVTSELSMALWENTPTPNTVAAGAFTYDDVTVDPNAPLQLIPVFDLTFTLAGQTFTEAEVSGAVQVRYQFGQLDGVVFDINATPGGYPYQQIHLNGGVATLNPVGGGAIPVPVDYVDRTTLAGPASRGTISFRNGEHNYTITILMETNTGSYPVTFNLGAANGNDAREALLAFLRDSGWNVQARGNSMIEIYGKTTAGGGLEPIKTMKVTLEHVTNDTLGIFVGGSNDVDVSKVVRKK